MKRAASLGIKPPLRVVLPLAVGGRAGPMFGVESDCTDRFSTSVYGCSEPNDRAEEP